MFHPLDMGSNGRRPDERAEVDRSAVLFHRAEPGIEAVGTGEVGRANGGAWFVNPGNGRRAVVRRSVRPPFAHDFGRDALSHLAHDPAISSQQVFARMTLNINKSRADHEPLRIDTLLCRGVAQQARRRDASDTAVRNGDIAMKPRVTRSVDDPPARDHDVVPRRVRTRGGFRQTACHRRLCGSNGVNSNESRDRREYNERGRAAADRHHGAWLLVLFHG